MVTAPAGGSWWKFCFVFCNFVLSFLPGHFTYWNCVFSLTFWEPPSAPANSLRNLFQIQIATISAYPKFCSELLSVPFPQLYLVEREHSHTVLCTNTHKRHIHLLTPKRSYEDSTNWRYCPSGLCSRWGMGLSTFLWKPDLILNLVIINSCSSSIVWIYKWNTFQLKAEWTLPLCLGKEAS